MRETSEEKIRERRQNLIRAADAHPNPDIGPLLEKSNADDLDWLLLRLNAQIAETPRPVDDPEESARLRATRNAVGDAFANRRKAEKLTRRQEMRRRPYWIKAGVLFTFLALLVAIVVAIFK